MFEGVSTYACLLYLTATPQTGFSYAKATTAESIPERSAYGRVRFARLRARKWELVTDEVYPVIAALESAGRPLGRLARIGVGLATLADKLFLLDGERDDATGYYVKRQDGETRLIEPGITVPIVKASALKSEAEIGAAPSRILFPYRLRDGKRRVIGESALRTNFPNAYAYLRSIRPLLDARDRGKPNPAAWYAFGRNQGIDSNFGVKLLTSGLNLSSRFLLCDDPAITFYSGYCVQTDAEDLRTLQKILNTPLMDFYIHHTSRSYRHGYKSYAKSFIQRFSVPHLTDDERRAICAETDAARLVDMLLPKYGLDLAAHPDLARFIKASPKMNEPLVAVEPLETSGRSDRLW